MKEETLKAGFERVTKFYADLKIPNPDGANGIGFHAIMLEPVKGDDTKSGWP